MSEKPDELSAAVWKLLLEMEPTLNDLNDEALKRASFVLSHLLGAVIALACVRHGPEFQPVMIKITQKQIIKSATQLQADGVRALQ